jgi:hypothetical protein
MSDHKIAINRFNPLGRLADQAIAAPVRFLMCRCGYEINVELTAIHADALSTTTDSDLRVREFCYGQIA